jgi:hypothetical protein
MLDFIWSVLKDVFAPGQLGFYMILLAAVGLSIRLTVASLQKFNRPNEANRILKLSDPISYMIMGAFAVDFLRQVVPTVMKICSKL